MGQSRRRHFGFLIGLSVTIGMVGVGIQPVQAQRQGEAINPASERPLKCTSEDVGIIGKKITCLVAVNAAKVTDIIVNRGNCDSPVLTVEERQSVNNFLNTLGPERAKFESLPAFHKNFYGLQLVFKGTEPGSQELGAAIIKWSNDPIRIYRFGDAMSFTVCPNWLEYTITVNGTNWSWVSK